MLDLGKIYCWKCTSQNVQVKKVRVGRERTTQEELQHGAEDKNIYSTFVVCSDCKYKFQPYQDAYLKQIVYNNERNNKIADLTIRFILAKQPSFIFVGLTPHAELLHQLIKTKLTLRGLNPELCKLVHGKLDDNEQTKADLIAGKVRAVVGTTVWSEGTNIKCLRWLIYAKAGLPGIELEQFIGRALRADKGKFRAGIIDFHDEHAKEFVKRARARKRFLQKKSFPMFELKEAQSKISGRRRFLQKI